MTNAAPKKGDVYLRLSGIDSYVEIASIADYSIATTGELSVAAWIRPDTLNFPRWEGTRYVHWLGKGDSGEQEWTFRMYNRDHTAENPPRPNRISFYTFNRKRSPTISLRSPGLAATSLVPGCSGSCVH